MTRYPRKMHGGELWAKIEVLENVFTPLFKNKFEKLNKGDRLK